nr:hypothetical protein CFP56_00933 [Quercus suber]
MAEAEPPTCSHLHGTRRLSSGGLHMRSIWSQCDVKVGGRVSKHNVYVSFVSKTAMATVKEKRRGTVPSVSRQQHYSTLVPYKLPTLASDLGSQPYSRQSRQYSIDVHESLLRPSSDVSSVEA